ncbi:type II secretion system protein GspK [Oceanicaulis sp. MMSF_3324]|uniref:type II secretion system protein GspK n=1 Tax=Oceanicaulis sp. MMSF_3324 TaxID=3046702 RepID=UPI00273E14C3|nr:type II secretion system protein GspK [Oceanicaulis sp. MMSF_3324]
MTQRDGYALPLTLAAIIVIALVAAMAAEQVRSSTQTVTRLSDQMRHRTDMISAEQTLIYNLLTEPMGRSGVAMGQVSDTTSLILGGSNSTQGGAMIRANGQAYRFSGSGIVVRLYDDQSFLNASSNDPAHITDILTLYGVPEPQHERLIAALRDYQDEDDLRTLAGAEAQDYETEGLPRNEPLRDVVELCAVQYWGETQVCEDAGRMLLTLRARTSDRLSPMLTSEAMIDLMLADEDRETVLETFRLYAQGQYSNFGQIGQGRLDQLRDPLSTITNPGPFLTLVTHTSDGATAQRTVIELTPNSLISPFVVHSKYAIGGEYSQNILRIESIEDVAPLPQSPSIPAER